MDACDFGTVKAYFRDASSEISQVALVQGSAKRHEVAALFVRPPQASAEGRGEEVLLDLLESGGVVKFGVDDIDRVSFSLREYAVRLDSIADDQLRYVLYLPPLYLVKMTDKKWR